MIEYPAVVPIAVVAAVALFVLRELLESLRRYRVNGRKLHAIRRFLAAECERNNFAISKMVDHAKSIRAALEKGHSVTIEGWKAGKPRLAIDTPDGSGSSPVPSIHSTELKGYLFEAAALDKYLFEDMEAALQALIEAAHLRDGFIEYVANDPLHLEAFVEYASPALEDTLEPIRTLYLRCTGEPLARSRVR